MTEALVLSWQVGEVPQSVQGNLWAVVIPVLDILIDHTTQLGETISSRVVDEAITS